MATCLNCHGTFRYLTSNHTQSCMGLYFDEYCAHFGLPAPKLDTGTRRCIECGRALSRRGTGQYCLRHDPTKPALAQPFFKRYAVEEAGFESPCWRWTGASHSDGDYGLVQFRGQYYPAHRAMYEWHTRTRLSAEVEVHHRCEHRWCVNPTHLEPLTHEEHGRRHAMSSDQIVAVFTARRSGSTLRQLAADFAVDVKTIQNVLYSNLYATQRAQLGLARPQTSRERIEALVPDILAAYAEGYGQRTVGELFDVDVNVVTRIVNAPKYEALRQQLGVVRPVDRVPKEDRLAPMVYRAYRRGEGSMKTIGERFGCDAPMVHRIVHHPKFTALRAQLDKELTAERAA